MLELTNKNYNATVVKITNLLALDGCDNVIAAIIMGNQVIVSKTVKPGDLGLFFPVETSLSSEYLKLNNLYRDKTLNKDSSKAGYFELNGRIRCVKFRGHKSEGLFMPLDSLSEFVNGSELVEGISFNKAGGTIICSKYFANPNKQQSLGKGKSKNKKAERVSKIVDNQFNFHEDTSQLYRNLHRFKPETKIHLSYKLHGTSGITANILCNKPLKWYEKMLRKFGVDISDKQYDMVYASRKVIKNEFITDKQHYYDVDIWGLASEKVFPLLQKGMTAYYEIVGYLPSGNMIQKDYDYGCEKGKFEIYVYRLTYTNIDGKVFEFTAQQVEDYCNSVGLKSVPKLFEGKVEDLMETSTEQSFLDELKKRYNEKECFMCLNKVPEEGAVIRIEEGLDIEAFKIKSLRFYERESALLDVNYEDIEVIN